MVGALLALGAEQTVENMRWKSEVREFRKSVDREIALNLNVFGISMKNRDCIKQRLEDLESWVRASSRGVFTPLAGPVGEPTYRSRYVGVWANKDNGVTAHLPMDIRLRYAEMYDEFENTSSVMMREREIWRDLGTAALGEPLDHQDRMRLYGLIVRARALNDAMIVNYPF